MPAQTWRIEGDTKVYGCFDRACRAARDWARKVSNPATVRYSGYREKPNHAIDRSDVLVYADGKRDPRIDPTWWSNVEKKT